MREESVKIEQAKVAAIVFLEDYIIEGTLHISLGMRYSDFFNKLKKDFIPVTNASIFSRDKKRLLYKANFMVINKNKIDSITPKEELR